MAEAEIIDEDLQSRQMAVYGRESMQMLRKASVLISGLNGLGAEIAKNVILANVRAVTLHDSNAVTAADCGANFYLSEDDIGKNRATTCLQQMQELNPGVQVRAVEGPFPQKLGEYTVVVAVDVPLELAKQADAYCRAQSPPIAFIRADVRGLCGSIFVDLGPSFRCLDPTGEVRFCAVTENPTCPAAAIALRRCRLCQACASACLPRSRTLSLCANVAGHQERHRREHRARRCTSNSRRPREDQSAMCRRRRPRPRRR